MRPQIRPMPDTPLDSEGLKATRKRPLAPKQDQDAVPDAATVAAASSLLPPAVPVPAGPARRGRRRMIHDEDQRKDRRKMQCKLNQRRYRARQRGMISTLSVETDTLTDSIQELESYHRFLVQFTQPPPTHPLLASVPVEAHRPTLVVTQFVRTFRHGFAVHSVEVSDVQTSFVRFIADQHLVSQGARNGHGVDALLLQLQRYTSYHAVFEMRVDSLRVDHAPARPPADRSRPTAVDDDIMCVLRVQGHLHLRLSRDTVMLLYPHLIPNESLSQRVMGQEIHPPFNMLFSFNAHSKVSKFELLVDFAQAFLTLLGSAADVATVLEKARITRYNELGMDPQETSGDSDDNSAAAVAASSSVTGHNKQLRLNFILM